jgi:YD repeat-containing protein
MDSATQPTVKTAMQRSLSRWFLPALLVLLAFFPVLAVPQSCPAPPGFLDNWLDGDETGAGDGADGGEAEQCQGNVGGDASGGSTGMMRASVQSLLVSLAISDKPLAYRPGKGPAVPLSFYYSQREANQPERFHYANLGLKWTYSGLSYIIDDPKRPGDKVQRYKAGGGTRRFRLEEFDTASGRFAPDGRDGSVLVRLTNPVRYERQLPDGGIETYAHSDGRDAFPRRFFLTERKDPAGNALKIRYDVKNRIIAVEDAAGGKTMLEYQHKDPLKITGIVDPAGRRARIKLEFAAFQNAPDRAPAHRGQARMARSNRMGSHVSPQGRERPQLRSQAQFLGLATAQIRHPRLGRIVDLGRVQAMIVITQSSIHSAAKALSIHL